jgi:Co/Zn/Cd efflux system component
MAHGCGCGQVKFDGQSAAYRRVLMIVIVLNASMFLVEIISGLAAQSMALKADAMDFLGDTLTYSLSLLVIGRSLAWRTRAALLKGISLAAGGAIVLALALWRAAAGGSPDAHVMGVVGALALATNIAAALLLLRFRNGDANVRSVWLCSRNDAIGNVAVMGAAAAVLASGSRWPDLMVAAAMASLFLHSAIRIIRQALSERQQQQPHRHAAAAPGAAPAAEPRLYERAGAQA